MVLGGIVELAIGIKAEGKSLEDITKPITATTGRAGARACRAAAEEDDHGRLRRDHHRHRRRRRHARAAPRPVRASASCCSSAATGCRASRRTGDAGRVRRQPLRLAGHLVRRRAASRSSPASTTSSAARPSCTAPRSTGCASEDFGELRHHDGISPAWPISYDELEPYYTHAEQLYQVHGARGEDPTEPPASAPYPYPGRLARAADPAALRRPRGGRLPAVPRALRDHARRGEHAVQRRASAARPATASRAWSTPSPTPRCSACGRRSSTRTSRCSRTRGSSRLETNDAGTAVTEVVVERDGREERYRGRRSSSSPAVRPTRAKLLLASANDKHPNGLANGSDQVGRNYMFHDQPAVLALSREENPTVFQKTLGLNDFYFGGDDFDYPLGQHPDGRQVAGADVPRREAARDEARARVDARADGARTRSTSGSRPRTCRDPTTASPSTATASITLTYTETNAGAEEAALRQAQVDAREARTCTRTT